MPAPTFLIGGAAKSGTTALAFYLRQHPDVFVAREKECHYFAFTDNRFPEFSGPGDASEFVPLIITDPTRYERCFAGASGEHAIGEASVYYLYQRDSLRAALRSNPKMKFLFILRDPLTRAFSAYSHQRRDGWETETTFEGALAHEEERIAAGWGWGWHYRAVSEYVSQLRAARAIIPDGQLYVILYEDLVAQSAKTMKTIFGFLGVNQQFVCDASLVLNASGIPKRPALNRFLTRQSAVKRAIKRGVPYNIGLAASQRLRNWNLVNESLSQDAVRRLAPTFLAGNDRDTLGQLTGCDLSRWTIFRDG